ncbi:MULTISPECIES: thioredoxin domain-containing protein [Methylococcus]|uniref:thioredoxin domain-containing protein n=2 Tax=Methylococcaceae TaxID=403 RepID=UPI00351ADAAC
MRGDFPLAADFQAPWCGPRRMMAPTFAPAAAHLEPRFRLAKFSTWAVLGPSFRQPRRSQLAIFRHGRSSRRKGYPNHRSLGCAPQGLILWGA